MRPLAGYLQELHGQNYAVSETCFYELAAGAATVAFQLVRILQDNRRYVCRLD